MEAWLIVVIIFLGIFLVLGLVFAILMIRVFRIIFSYPENEPSNFLEKLDQLSEDERKRKRIVFVGDSLTHGNLSVNYIDMVAEELGEETYHYINAGRNSELAYNVVVRLDEIIECEPDIITILIGTNDANRELGYYHSKQYDKILKLPREADKDWFRENLKKIIGTLKTKTDARIAVCSIPILGEIETHPIYKQTIIYSKIIKELAEEEKVAYLAVNEEMVELIAKSNNKPRHEYTKRLIEKAAMMRYILLMNFDQISEFYSFELLTDQIHLNSKGARIIAEKITEFIKKNEKS